MRWKEKKHKWALDIDGHLFGSRRYRNAELVGGESGAETMLFRTKRDAQYFVSTHGWDVKPRIVKVQPYYIELVKE